MALVDSITFGNLSLIEVDADPTVSPVSAVVGSIAVINDGTTTIIWQKIDTGDTDWRIVGEFNDGGEARGKDRSLGNTDDYKLSFKTDDKSRFEIDGSKVILKHPSNPDSDVIFDTNNGFGGFGISKPGASGFMNYMPNAQTTQIIFADPNAPTGVNRLFLDVDNGGDMYLQTLPGAGASGEIIATDGSPLRPDNDGTSDLGRADKRWKKLYVKDIDFNGDIGGLSLQLSRTIFVDKNGNDTTGDGSISKPYITIGKAITEASALTPALGNSVRILIGVGVFAENPLTIPENVILEGSGLRGTTIAPLDQNSNLITATNDFTIKNMNIGSLTTNASTYCLSISGTQPRGVIIAECSFFSAINGINITATDSEFKPFIDNCAFVSISGTCINTGGSSSNTIVNSRLIGNGTTTVAIKTNGTAKTVISGGTLRECNVGVNQGSTGETIIGMTDLTDCNIPLIKTNTSKVKIKGASAILANAQVTELEGLNGYVVDGVQGEEKLRVFDELSVGLPGDGFESVFGEGDSYTNGMLVYTFNGTSYVDVSDDAKTRTGSSFTFTGTGTANKLYVSAQRFTAGTIDPIKWFGIKQSCLTAAAGGEIIAEYWNGSSWVEFNHLSTESSGQYIPYAKQIFQRTGSEQIRFNDKIDDDWAINDPVSLGTDLYWVRFSIVSTLTTAPVFEQFKIHSNRTEINEDGYIEYFGKARPFAALPFDTATFQAANNSPGNNDVYFGDSLAVGRIENLFQDGATDRSGFVIPFPEDLDTSCPVIATFYWSRVNGSDTVPGYDFTLRWANSIDGDTVGNSTGDVPTTAPRQQTLTQTFDASSVGNNEQFSITFEMDISQVITRRATGTPDLFWCTIQRDNDGNTSEIVLIQCAFRYTKRTNGGHL